MSTNFRTAILATFVAAFGVVGCNSDAATDAKAKMDDASKSVKATANDAKDKASKLTLDGKEGADAAADAVQSGPKTSVSFANLDHDFGSIDQNTENEHIFKFTNTGSEPLIISKAKGSCGCTVPEYPKEPIAPGADGEIRVVYKPGKQKNKQTKRVTVTANTEPEQTILKITAEVQELPS